MLKLINVNVKTCVNVDVKYYNYVLHNYECDNVIIQVYYLPTAVISEPDDVTVFEGRPTTFTCILDGSISSDDVQWYRLIMDTSTAERINQSNNINFITAVINNTLNSSLTITNAVKSYTGYYWVRLPSDDVCNVSLTVGTSMWIQFI